MLRFFQLLWKDSEAVKNVKDKAVVSGVSGGKTYVWEVEKAVRKFYDEGKSFKVDSKNFLCE